MAKVQQYREVAFSNHCVEAVTVEPVVSDASRTFGIDELEPVEVKLTPAATYSGGCICPADSAPSSRDRGGSILPTVDEGNGFVTFHLGDDSQAMDLEPVESLEHAASPGMFVPYENFLLEHPELAPDPELIAVQRAGLQAEAEFRGRSQGNADGPRMVGGLNRRERRDCGHVGRARTRTRARRPRIVRRRHYASRSTPSGEDGSSGGDPPAPDLIWGTACAHLSQPIHTDRAGADHCGGYGVSRWEGVR